MKQSIELSILKSNGPVDCHKTKNSRGEIGKYKLFAQPFPLDLLLRLLLPFFFSFIKLLKHMLVCHVLQERNHGVRFRMIVIVFIKPLHVSMKKNLCERKKKCEDEPEVHHLKIGCCGQVIGNADEHGRQD